MVKNVKMWHTSCLTIRKKLLKLIGRIILLRLNILVTWNQFNFYGYLANVCIKMLIEKPYAFHKLAEKMYTLLKFYRMAIVVECQQNIEWYQNGAFVMLIRCWHVVTIKLILKIDAGVSIWHRKKRRIVW